MSRHRLRHTLVLCARGGLGLMIAGCFSKDCGSSCAGTAADDVPLDAASAALPVDASARVRTDSTLMALVNRVEAGEHRDACEDKVREPRRVVAAAIDRAWRDIEARGNSLAEAPPYRRSKFGPTYLRERDQAARPGEPAGWTTLDRSWTSLATTLAALPRTDAGPIDEGWVSLARDARTLLLFDVSRVVGASWHDASRSSLPPANVTPNPGVERDGTVLTVLLDPGPFDGEKARLARIIESVWTSRALAVHVRWTSQSAEPRAHRFVVGHVQGEPSYVTERLRQVHLNPDVRAVTIAHEIGHVLGFVDRYAKTFDTTRCAYVEERDSRDIMSDPEGPVTAEEWTLLADAYRNSGVRDR